MLSKNLRALRTSANLTQEQVANQLNITRPAYNCYENNRAQPSITSLVIMAKMYHVSIDEILGFPVQTGSTPAGNVSSYPAPYKRSILPNLADLDSDEQDILLSYRVLSDETKKQLKEYIAELRDSKKK